MAVDTAVRSTQDLKLSIGTATTTGGTTCSTFYVLPILSPPTILDITAPLEEASPILGTHTMSKSGAFHNRTNKMYEISFSVLASPTIMDLMCLYAYEDGDGVNNLIGNYRPPNWINGATATDTQNIYIQGAGFSENTASTDENSDMYFKGCVCTSLELTHAIDSESGKPVANMTFVTGYNPEYGDNMSDGEAPHNTAVNLTGEGSPNFSDWTTATDIHSSDAGYQIHPYSYSLSMARDVQRIGYVNATDFSPIGYTMVGQWDVSMNCTYKRDANFTNLKSLLYDSTYIYIDMYGNTGGNDWNVFCYGKVTEGGVDTGNPELRNTITLKGMGDVESATAYCGMSM